MSERFTEEQYTEAFRRKLARHAFTRDDHLDVDPPVTIADSGAHVQVWLWISDDEVEEMGLKPERGDGDCGACQHWCSPEDGQAFCDNDESPHYSKSTLYTDSCPEYEAEEDDEDEPEDDEEEE